MEIEVNDTLFTSCIHSLQKLIQIPSVKEDAIGNAPFGKSINQALELFLDIADGLGFYTRNLDGYAGIVEMGEGQEELGVLVHIDVVPPGDVSKWVDEPFSGVIKDGSIWGRGTLDDKGPAIAVLYAMKILKEMGLNWNRRTRLIIGTDEESTWEGIAYYKKHEKPPTLAFTPDGCFPVTHSEKGILSIRYDKEVTNPSLVESVIAGEKHNMTPGKATAILKQKPKILTNYRTDDSSITISSNADGKCVITATGKDGRTSSPVVEENAIHILLNELKKILPSTDAFHEVITFYETYLQQINGLGHDCVLEDDVSGDLTLATCVLKWDGKHATFVSDIRYPSTYNKHGILTRFTERLDTSNFEWEIIDHKESIYIPEESAFIQELLTIYNDYFQTNAKPESISGGTYARAFPNTVAFGALIPGKPLNAHEVNEHVELEVIEHWINIYARTIYQLAVTTN